MNKIGLIIILMFLITSCSSLPSAKNDKGKAEYTNVFSKPLSKYRKKTTCKLAPLETNLSKLIDIANSCLITKNYKLVHQISQQMAIEFKNEPWSYYYQSMIWYKDRKYKKALIYMNDALSIAPKIAMLNYQKAVLLDQLNYVEQSRNFSEKTIDLDSKILGAHILLSKILLEKNESKKALKSVTNGIDKFPKSITLALLKADILIKMDKFDKALPILKKYENSAKYKYDIYYKTAYVYEKLENMKMTSRYLSKIRKKNLTAINRKYQDNIQSRLQEINKEISSQKLSKQRVPADTNKSGDVK